MATECLDWALTDCSGYVAADALYDGPCCRLSAVDKRCDQRLLSAVVDHAPDHHDIRAFLGRLQAALDARDWTLRGITPAGASLSPTPLAEVLRGVPHQLCQFHVVKAIVTAVLGAVSSERKRLTAKHPPLPRGRPRTKAAKQAARKNKRLEHQGAEWCKQRDLWVRHHLSPSARKQWWRITRGFSQLQKLREILAHVYRLFDRRCRTQTAMDKLTRLRHRLSRFRHLNEALKKLFAPTLEKALTFLADQWLPSTSSKAVERGNRRYRKMPKSIDSVRTQEQSKARIALDRWRAAQSAGRDQSLHTLHAARAGERSPVSLLQSPNNAGIITDIGPVPERLPHDLFEQTVRVNLLGVWYCCREVGARMLNDGKGGSIINISSILGLGGQQNYPPAYQATKAAVLNLGRALACSWADRGVRVNALAPGYFPSEMTNAFFASPAFLNRVQAQAPMGRIGQPEELAGALLFLASDASSFMTGQTLVVDGGLSANIGSMPLTDELFGLFEAIAPDGLGKVPA